MRYTALLATVGVIASGSALAAGADNLKWHDLEVNGEKWLRTMITPLDDSSNARRELTYKVYTQLFDFEGEDFITKGAGGKYTHHRGLFIGWKDTLVDGEDYDTWHMPNCYQEHVRWLRRATGPDGGAQMQVIEWRNNDHEAFIREVRTIRAHPGDAGRRVIDFASELEALHTDIRLRGDLQHAGMQIRMTNEVSRHEDSTQYVLPVGAEELDGDEVVGAWWVLGSFIVDGQRYWVVHMTHPNLVTGQPVYSIRRYGRFGAFFEPDLEQGVPLEVKFRVVVSKDELTREDCDGLCEAYRGTIHDEE